MEYTKEQLKEMILEMLRDKEIQEAVSEFIWDMPIPEKYAPQALTEQEKVLVDG